MEISYLRDLSFNVIKGHNKFYGMHLVKFLLRYTDKEKYTAVYQSKLSLPQQNATLLRATGSTKHRSLEMLLKFLNTKSFLILFWSLLWYFYKIVLELVELLVN